MVLPLAGWDSKGSIMPIGTKLKYYQLDEDNDNLCVLCAESGEGTHEIQPIARWAHNLAVPTSTNASTLAPHPLELTISTQSVMISRKYRVVFSLDVSPSMTTVDPVTEDVLLDQAFCALEKFIRALAVPVALPGIPYQVSQSQHKPHHTCQ